MTAINRLPSKATPIDNDLVVIWDSQSGRARNTTFAGVKELILGGSNPVTDVTYLAPNLTITYYDGTTKNIDIS